MLAFDFSLKNVLLVSAATWLGTTPLPAQGTRADYERAAKLRDLTANKVFKQTLRPHWLEGNRRFWYRNDLPGDKREFVLVDTEAGTRRPAFDHARLGEALSKAAGKGASGEMLSVDALEFSDNPAALLFSAAGKRWRCDLATYELREVAKAAAVKSAIQAEDRPRPSRRTGEETSLTFVNRTRQAVELFWINEAGERQLSAPPPRGAEHPQHPFAGHVWLAADAAGKTLAVFEATEAGGEALIETNNQPKAQAPARPPRPARGGAQSPDGRWRALIKDHNVRVRDLKSDVESSLTSDGTAEDFYTTEFRWSPDSGKLVVTRRQPAQEHKVYLVESSPRDQVQPKLRTIDYLKPGDRVEQNYPHLFDLATRKEIEVKHDLFTNQWSLSELRWAPDSSRFTFLFNQRGHQVLRIVAVDASTGAARALVEEQSRTFINYSGRFFYRHLDASGEILWMSERDGWAHLYLYDAATGRLKNQITRGDWVVRGVEEVDEKNRQIWFRAGGIRAGQDPYYLHYCRVNFDGTGLVVLTESEGSHKIEFSPDRRFLIDTWSRVDWPPAHELRRTSDGRRLCALEQADWDGLLQTGWRIPERFVAKGRDGKTAIYGVIWRPTQFDPSKKYPVIEDIYAGPQDSFVPKTFHTHYSQQSLAELGFIVVQMDGMGTANRSKAFHDVCFKNLKDAGFPDRIPWLKAAAATRPYMDLTRVGIYGGSAGGQSALGGLLFFGDFYKVGVADCGCHDNRMDKIWWNEQWMGWPIGPEYGDNSNVTHAAKLQGKLMLVVGELDNNVDPASTLQVVNALEKANKDFDLLLMTGTGHGAAEGAYSSRRRADFFVRHLLGVEPRAR
jgi:dipeptidyl-peptidase 4